MISFPDNLVSNIITHTNNIIAELSPFLVLILGVLLGAVVLEIIIGAIRK